MEMILLRMLAFRPAGAGNERAAPPAAVAAPAARGAGPQALSLPPAETASWPQLLSRLELQGAARQLAGNCQLLEREGNRFRFLLDPRAQSLHTRQQEERLATALGRLVGAAVSVEIEVGGATDTPAQREEQARDERLEQARASIERDPNVKALRDRFGAVVQPDSIKPVG
jgi:DNA polymerase-3 subunit gamma/tau